MNILGLGGPLGLSLVTAGALAVYAGLRWLRRTTPIHPIHPGKADTCECKFDREEARRPHLLAPPPIDLSNLPPPDPRVVAELQKLTVAEVQDLLEQLTGEKPVTLQGTTAPIATRNTFSKDIERAFQLLEALYASIGVPTKRYSYQVRGRTFYNLEAITPGLDAGEKEKYFGSHIDCTAGDTRRAEAKSYGADDDGSGTIGVFLIARAFKNLGLPGRFLHFSGEEQGLWGSYTYSDIVAKENRALMGLIQVDMIGWCAKPGNRVDIHDEVNRNGSHFITTALVRAVKRYGLNLNPVDTHNRALANRSDQAGFLDHGYAAVLVSEEFSDDGFNPNYHSLGDRVRTLNLPFMVEVVRMIIAGGADMKPPK
jgi:hypothetical protein